MPLGIWQPLLNPDGTPQMLRPDLVGRRGAAVSDEEFVAAIFRTDGPNAPTSTAYAEDFNEVKAIGSVNSTIRTPEQTHIQRSSGRTGGRSGTSVEWRSFRSLVADPEIRSRHRR